VREHKVDGQFYKIKGDLKGKQDTFFGGPKRPVEGKEGN
jgi:hypothetical protein